MADRRRVIQPTQSKRDTRVQQSAARDADINHIVNRHLAGPGRQGLPIGNPNAVRQPRFMDVPSQSYHDMLNQVADIQTQFRTLPSRLRGRFQNDPYQLLRFTENPANRDESLRLGLVLPTEDEFEKMRLEGLSVTRQEVPPSEKQPKSPAEPPGGPQADPEAQPSYSPPRASSRSKT